MIFFGDKTVALFDLWSLEHFCAGCNTAVVIAFITKKYFHQHDRKTQAIFQVMMMLLLEFYWEIFEHYLEAGASVERVTYWFQGVEYIWNRAIIDPAVTLSGFLFIRKYPNTKMIFAVFSALWLYVNIFVFEDCMGLNRLLVDLIHNHF